MSQHCGYLGHEVLFHIVLLWVSGKESPCSAGDKGDAGSIPGSGRSAGEGNGNPPQYSCLENPMNRGAWWATYSLWVTKSRTQLTDWALWVQNCSELETEGKRGGNNCCFYGCLHRKPCKSHGLFTWSFQVLSRGSSWMSESTLSVRGSVCVHSASRSI